MANSQQINIGLKFNADVGQARQQLESLKSSLNSLGSLNNIDPTARMNKNIGESIAAVAKLKTQLEAATNINTGRLDLTKFSKQLRNSGMDLDQYRKQLSSLGPQGKQAFLDLASSIQQAEMPLLSLNKLASSLWDSLKRTAKWQISSSAIHAIMGAVQSAYHYAQDLNESLNNIRIVTGQSTQQMAKFAAEANKAAKALGTTTTAYTDAALIYYQQGLSDSEVKERTDITVKMANVARESAETVSDQLTAVWNNFDNGTDTLESFADKMVALGAATASSSDEIAQGLEKFAATAETTGLSFDYAAAALATVTAQTRQSADTVGTAFKTIFARLESLKLGDTLEDGTDLTKYSEALATVGVNIKDANGQLKNMDTIINETMVKWQTLSKDQQVALANTVAGQRQYNTFMALMSNADFFKENLQTINESTGALNKQNEIYQESWEAASKRVQAAMEGIYQKLIDDKFFIEATEALEKFINLISRSIDAMGGLGGLLTTVGTIATTLFNKQLTTGIRNLSFDIQNLLTNGAKAEQMRMDAEQNVQQMLVTETNPVIKQQAESYFAIGSMIREINVNASKLTSENKTQLEQMVQMRQLKAEELTDTQRAIELLRKQRSETNQQIDQFSIRNSNASNITKESLISGPNGDLIKEKEQKLSSLEQSIQELQVREAQFNKDNPAGKASTSSDDAYRGGMRLVEQLESAKAQRDNLMAELTGLKEASSTLSPEALDIVKQLPGVQDIFIELGTLLEQSAEKVTLFSESFSGLKLVLNDSGSVETSNNALVNFIDQLKDNEPVLNSFLNQLNNSEALKPFQEFFDDANLDAQQLVERLREVDLSSLSSEEAEKFAAALKGVQSVAQGVENEFIKQDATLSRTIEQIIRSSGLEEEGQAEILALYKQKNGISKELIATLIKLKEKQAEAKKQEEEFKKEMQQSTLGTKDLAAGLVSATTALSSLGMTINGVKGLIDVLSNPDTSGWEKFTQILISVPMITNGVVRTFTEGRNAISNFASGFTGLGQGIKATGTAMSILEAATNANTAAQALSLTQEQKNAAMDALTFFLTKENTEETRKAAQATLEKTLIEKGMNAEKAKGAAATLIKIATDKAETAGTEKNTLAIIKNIIARKLQHPILLAITVALVALIGIIIAITNAEDKSTKQLKQLNKAREEERESLNQLTESYNSLKSAIDSINNAEIDIANKVKGTLEWKEAVAHLNEEVLALLEKYPQLEAYVDEDGIWHIKQESYNDMLDTMLGEQANANKRAGAKAYRKEQIETGQILDEIIPIDSSIDIEQTLKNIIKQLYPNNEQHQRNLFEELNDIKEIGSYLDYSQFIAANGGQDAFESDELQVAKQFYNQILNTPEQQNLHNKQQAQQNEQNRAGINFAKTLGENVDDFSAQYVADQIANIDYDNITSEQKKKAEDAIKAEIAAITGEAVDDLEFENGKLKNSEGFYYDKDTGKFSADKSSNGTSFKTSIQETPKDIALIEAGTDALNGADNARTELENALARVKPQQKSNYDSLVNILKKQTGDQYSDELINTYLLQNDEYKDLAQKGIWNKTQQTLIDQADLSDKEKTAFQNQIRNFQAQWDKLSDEEKTLIGNFELKFDKDSGTVEEQWEKYKQEQQQLLTARANQQGKDAFQKEIDAGKFKKADLDNFEAYRDYLLETDGLLKDNAEAANEVALANMKLNHGVKDLVDNLDTYKEELKHIGSPEYANSLKAIKDNIADIANIGIDDISDSFATSANTLTILGKIAKGDTNAIYELQEAAAKSIIIDLDIDKDATSKLNSAIDILINGLKIEDIKIGASLDTVEFDNALVDLITKLGLSTEEMQKIFNSLGWEPEIEYKEISIKDWDQATQTAYLQGPNGTYEEITSDTKLNKDTHVFIPTISSSKTVYRGTPKSIISQESLTPKSKGNSGSGEKKNKRTEKEIDRYHEVNEKLDDVAKNLEKINTLKDRAFGASHLAAIDEEIKLLGEENSLLDDKIKENLDYLAKDKGLAASYGAQFDEYGRITNYNDLIRAAVNKYNASSKENEDEEAYTNVKEALDKYEESLNLAEDLTEEKAENMRKILDAKFEKVEYTVEVKLKITDFKNNILDWELEQLEDLDFVAGRRIGLQTQKANLAQETFNANKEGVQGILKAAGATDEQVAAFFAGDGSVATGLELTNQAMEDIQSYVEGMKEAHSTLREIKKTIEEELVNSWEKYNEKLEKTTEIYDHLNKRIDFFKDTIDLLGTKRLGVSNELYERVLQTSAKLNQAQLESSVKMQKKLTEDLERAQAERAKAATEEDQQYWDNFIEQIEDKLNETTDNIYSQGTELIQKLQDNFTEMVDKIFKDFEEQMTGVYGSFEELSNAFDQQKTLAEEYLPEYQKTYELNKLNRNLNQEMSKLGASNSHNLERLKDLQAEITQLQADGTEMSQYDLEYLQKKYDLRLAEIALEEAQNNKNQVRLTRDTSGNYNYVYTADENAVDEANQKYEDAMYNAQKLSEDYLTSTSENIIALMKEYDEALKEILNDASLTAEERNKKIAMLDEFYSRHLKYLADENGKALINNRILYNDDYLNYGASRDAITRKGTEFTTDFNKTILGTMLTNHNTYYTSLGQYADDYLKKLGTVDDDKANTVLGQIGARSKATETAINSVLKIITGTDMTNFNTALSGELDKTDTRVDTTKKEFDTLYEEAKKDLDNLFSKVSDIQEQLQTPLQNMATDIEGTAKAFTKVSESLVGLPGKIKEVATEYSNLGGAVGAVAEQGAQLTNLTGQKPTGATFKEYGYDDTHHWKIFSDGSTGEKSPHKYKGSEIQPTVTGVAIRCSVCGYRKTFSINANQHGWITNSGDIYYAKSLQERDEHLKGEVLYKFDTGGYTGSWGSDGKLAILHEKELVLNKEDTKNILATIDIVRQLDKAIDLQKLSLSKQMNDIYAQKTLANYNNASNNNVTQEIHIDASFPGVTAREEIEQAFADLALQANQYIHRY